LKLEHLDGSRGYLHVVNGKGGKQRTSISSKPILDTLEAHLNGLDVGYVFEGRDHGHISTWQIQRLLDSVAERAGLQLMGQSIVKEIDGSYIIYSKLAVLPSMHEN
jgi:integrase